MEERERYLLAMEERERSPEKHWRGEGPPGKQWRRERGEQQFNMIKDVHHLDMVVDR